VASDTSGSRGSIVASLILNADPFEAGLKTGEDAARRASGSIGASLDRINKKQLNVAATSLLKNFVSPAALAVAGASMATDLIAGFSTGKFKNWEEAGRGLMEALKTGIESIPIVGTFAKLGEAIGNAAFGIDKANASLAETNKQIAATDILVKSLNDNNKYKIDSEQAVQKRISDIGKSAKVKELEAFKANLLAQDKIILDNEIKQYNSSLKVIEKKIKVQQGPMRGGGSRGGGFNSDVMVDNPNYLRDVNQQEADRNSMILKRKEEQENAFYYQVKNMREILDFEERANINEQKRLDGIKLEEQMRNQAVRAANELLEVERRQANVQAEANAKFSQHMADKKEAQTQDLKNAQQAQAMGLQDSATGVSSAIGNIKVAGTMDFTKSKEMELAQAQLASTVRQENELKSLAETMRKMGVTP
jgi:hypothetical protein